MSKSHIVIFLQRPVSELYSCCVVIFSNIITSLLHFAGMGQGIVSSPKPSDPLRSITHLIQGAAGRGGLSPRVN